MVDNIIVYTANLGRTDDLQAVRPAHGVRCVCISDDPVPSGWTRMAPVMRFSDSRRTARWHKIHSSALFPNVITVWQDAVLRPDIDGLQLFLQKYRQYRSIFETYRHPFRNCVYREAAACVLLGHTKEAEAAAQMREYARRGHPPSWGLYETTVVVRRPSRAVEQLELAWWRELERYTCRDQLSLPVVVRELGMKEAIGVLPGCREWSPFFRFKEHAWRSR